MGVFNFFSIPTPIYYVFDGSQGREINNDCCGCCTKTYRKHCPCLLGAIPNAEPLGVTIVNSRPSHKRRRRVSFFFFVKRSFRVSNTVCSDYRTWIHSVLENRINSSSSRVINHFMLLKTYVIKHAITVLKIHLI